MVIDKKERVCLIVDIAVPADRRVEEKEQEKIEKYQDLKREIGRMWEIRKVQVVPVVIGAIIIIVCSSLCSGCSYCRSYSC